MFFITNAGGSPLEWSWVPDDSPVPVVQPESGTVAPGGSQFVSFEMSSQNPDFVYPLTFESSHHTRLDELRTPCKFHHRQEHKGRKPADDQIRSRGRPTANDDGLPLSA